MAADTGTIPTWHKDRAKENAMGPAHAPVWRHLVELVPERDLSARSILDFGCNQGGFLRMLHAIRPFRFGLGVDIAADSVARAEAFSHEVIYLLPDVAEHARQMWAALRDGGIYYAVTGCHTGNRLWPHWRELIPATTNVQTQDRSLDDYAAAFAGAGFEVSMKRFGFPGFLPYTGDSDYYPTMDDRIYYLTEAKTLFRLVRNG